MTIITPETFARWAKTLYNKTTWNTIPREHFKDVQDMHTDLCWYANGPAPMAMIPKGFVVPGLVFARAFAAIERHRNDCQIYRPEHLDLTSLAAELAKIERGG